MNILATLLVLLVPTFGYAANNPIDTAYVDSVGVLFFRINQSVDTVHVERFINNFWLSDTSFINTTSKIYSYKPNFHSGVNKFRLKLSDTNEYVSEIFEYYQAYPDPVFHARGYTEYFNFDKWYKYSILDKDGNLVKEGEGKQVDLRELNMGIYYINYGNKTRKIFKKKQ